MGKLNEDQYIYDTLIARLREERYEDIVPFLSTKCRDLPHAINAFRAALEAFVKSRDIDTLKAVDAVLDRSNCLKVFSRYYAAWAFAQNGEVDETGRLLTDTCQLLNGAAEILKVYEGFNHLVITALQMAIYIDSDYTFFDSAEDEAALDITKLAPASTSLPFILLTSSNGTYFDIYFEDYIRSVQNIGSRPVVHVHISNPTSNSEHIFKSTTYGIDADVRLTTEKAPESPAYYACRRFMIAPDLIDFYEKDALITDIDTVFTKNIPALPATIGSHDAGLFMRHGCSPQEIFHCSLSYFRNTASTLQGLRWMRPYMLQKLTEFDSWMLDQCSLFLLANRASQGRHDRAWSDLADFSMCDLETTSGRPLEYFSVNQDKPHEQRNELRAYQDFHKLNVSFSLKGRPIVSGLSIKDR